MRRGRADGRGILSDGGLAEFCRFFVAACLDQVRFMRTLLSREMLSDRAWGFVAAEAAGAGWTCAEGPFLVGTSDRQARRLVQPLAARGLLTGAKNAPLRIAFPLGETERLFPHRWAPSGVASEAAALPEIEEAVRLPHHP